MSEATDEVEVASLTNDENVPYTVETSVDEEPKLIAVDPAITESLPVDPPREDPVVVPSMTKEQIEQARQIKEGLMILTVVFVFAIVVTKMAGAW